MMITYQFIFIAVIIVTISSSHYFCGIFFPNEKYGTYHFDLIPVIINAFDFPVFIDGTWLYYSLILGRADSCPVQVRSSREREREREREIK